ncbi:putative glucan endo-1,3-beta-glucosidase GVI isoform X2 [Euphorbia lathyris]|uniref:putative glucan endo-1,3-beta-glucosidase GVI isoform X2 n=1 Tax=Euphorbia lathyris TaxID=212925 RepID=UPI0033144D48
MWLLRLKQVLQTPDFRNCRAAHELQMRAQGIGVNYGLLGDNLPNPNQVISLLKSKNVQQIRIFDPNPEVLTAAENSGISVILGVRNEDLQQLSASPAFATNWVSTNVLPYFPATKIKYISAGNEVIPGPLAQFVLGAIQNLDAALIAANIHIPVSTAISFQAIGQSFPPSTGAFSGDSIPILTPLVGFLSSKKYPLLANVYPYFAYIGDPSEIRIDYAVGNATSVIVNDGGIQYSRLFDAMVDTVYAALEKIGGSGVNVVVSETGWPSAENGNFATIDNAQTYVNGVINHVKNSGGTPRKPQTPIEAYIFAIFNEDLKPPGTEQHFGLFYPNQSPVYPVTF